MSLDIVLVNFCTASLTVECLRSLAKVRGELVNCRVIVVDNASGDGSAGRIEMAIASAGWNQWMTLVRSEANLGFAGGNNLALQRIMADAGGAAYILLLNSDTIVHAGVLRHCFQVMETDPSIGVMSCRLLNTDGSIQNVTRRFPSPVRQSICALGLPWKLPWAFAWANGYEVPAEMLLQKRDCDWIGGAFMFIRREALRRVGLMDESFFFYGEDIEFCYRFHKAGYRVHYDPAVAITHVGAASSDPTRMASKVRSVRTWQARYLVQRKCFGRLAAWWLRLVDVIVVGLRKMWLSCSGAGRTEKYRATAEAFSMLIRPLKP